MTDSTADGPGVSDDLLADFRVARDHIDSAIDRLESGRDGGGGGGGRGGGHHGDETASRVSPCPECGA